MGFKEEYIKTLIECGRYEEAQEIIEKDSDYGLFNRKQKSFKDHIRESERRCKGRK